jgi:tRNA modification GTPase
VFSPTDTIVAIATAPMRAGIGIVRISGPGAHAVARGILSAPRDLEPRRATFTHVRAAGSRSPWAPGSLEPPNIDQVVATFFPAPHSYTAEDVVEISAHGSLALLREIVRSAIHAGARLAEPGEFTLRAFLNGRIDLVQAEAVADLVDAVTPLQARAAFDQLEGTLTRAISAVDRELFDLAARLEACVDFPDEGYHFVAPGEAAALLGRLREALGDLLATCAAGRVIREGRHIAILGKPNVGKSSLFNQLVGTDRAIVAPGPGTTRDMLHEAVDLDGIRLGLVDTAGIRSSDDDVEQEGVARARKAAGVADLVVLVLDRSRPLEDVDRALLEETASAPRVVVINKTDLIAAWAPDELGAASWPPAAQGVGDTPGREAVLVSLKTGAGLGALRAAMRAALDAAEPLRDAPMVTNLRHEVLLRRAHEAIVRAICNLETAGESASEELVLADLADARGALEEVTGKRTTEDLLKRIFEKFCIGK